MQQTSSQQYISLCSITSIITSDKKAGFLCTFVYLQDYSKSCEWIEIIFFVG